EPHALHSFIAEEYDNKKSVNNALFIVYEAKKNAENAPGVGTKHDFWIIENNKITKIKEETLKELDTIYIQKKGTLKKGNDEIEDKIKNLIL
ncbi:MAG: hypothetical protein NTZ83_03160, partial [Candidatus Pacearchaeota archaeon]|nr:hypothetical protein [Candidatus Pacearchaeota archaeon]